MLELHDIKVPNENFDIRGDFGLPKHNILVKTFYRPLEVFLIVVIQDIKVTRIVGSPR